MGTKLTTTLPYENDFHELDCKFVSQPMDLNMLAVRINDEYIRIHLVKEKKMSAVFTANGVNLSAQYKRGDFHIGENRVIEMSDQEMFDTNKTIIKQ